MKYKYLCLIVAVLCTIITSGVFWIEGPFIMKAGFTVSSIWSWIHYYTFGRKTNYYEV